MPQRMISEDHSSQCVSSSSMFERVGRQSTTPPDWFVGACVTALEEGWQRGSWAVSRRRRDQNTAEMVRECVYGGIDAEPEPEMYYSVAGGVMLHSGCSAGEPISSARAAMSLEIARLGARQAGGGTECGCTIVAALQLGLLGCW